MSFLKIILTCIANVENVCNLQCLNDSSISSMMPVSQVNSSWKNFIRVAISNDPKNEKGLRKIKKIFSEKYISEIAKQKDIK